MFRILFTLFMLAGLGFSFVACDEDSGTTPDSVNFMDQPTAQPAPADPKIVYSHGSAQSISVMDTTGSHQTVIHTISSGSIKTPNWSPGNSIVWIESSTTGASIRACDISVSAGNPVSSNFRTITSVSTAYPTLQNAHWSSTSNTNKIAFVLYAGSAGTDRNYICRVSPSGGTWDTLYSTDHTILIAGLSWNSDDTRLAVLVKTSTWNSFVILNTTTGAVTDSIPVSISVIPAPVSGGNSFEWSRAGLNKLVFVSDGKIYYITPTAGSSPSTNNVSWAMVGSATWSPSNSHVMFIKDAGSQGWQLYKNTAQTSTVKQIDRTFVVGEMHWHR